MNINNVNYKVLYMRKMITLFVILFFIFTQSSAMSLNQKLGLRHILQDHTPREKKSNRELSFEELSKNSSNFNNKIKFQTSNNRIENIAKSQDEKIKIEQQAKQTYVILHQKTMSLIHAFMGYKKMNGTQIEKKIYQKMNSDAFIERLITKRPLMFMKDIDEHLLRPGFNSRNKNNNTFGGFEAIGTVNEKKPLVLEDYLSYDEMQLAALLGVSVPTFFINKGDRDNCGKKGTPGTYEPEGVYVGLVGARFEKRNLMEWKHMMITPHQNTVADGYGKDNATNNLLSIWKKFYQTDFPTHEEAKADTSGKYFPLSNSNYFNKDVYKKRIQMVVEPFLHDANHRAFHSNKKAYVHFVGLGLGQWQVEPAMQTSVIINAVKQAIEDNALPNISDIDFSWFTSASNTDSLINGQQLKTINNTVTIHFSKRNPADPLTGNDQGKLLVAAYPWDGNAYPGNEYWAGDLIGSGDPAAACCSTIPELQNPEINLYFAKQYQVYGAETVNGLIIQKIKKLPIPSKYI